MNFFKKIFFVLLILNLSSIQAKAVPSSFADLADVTDGNTGSRFGNASGGATRRGNGHDTNDMNHLNWHAIDTPNTTSAVTYSPFMKQEASGTNVIYIGHSSGNNSNWGFHSFYQATIMEIKV